MGEPSKQNVRDFVNARSPLISFVIAWFFLGLTFILYALHVGQNSHIVDPDVTTDWNSILEKTNKLKGCLKNEKFVLPGYSNQKVVQIETATKIPETLTNEDESYYVISLGVAANYIPSENYLEGDYHGQADRDSIMHPNYGTAYGQVVKPHTLGIFPDEKPKHTDEKDWYGNHSIFISYEFSSNYKSQLSCQNQTVSSKNKYSHQDKAITQTVCNDQRVFSCVSYFIPAKMYVNTPSLLHSALPPHTSNHENKKDPLRNDVSTMCKLPERAMIQKFSVQTNDAEKQPCASYLYAATTHEYDPVLVRILDESSRDRVFHRVFYSGLLLCFVCLSFLLWGAFRGSKRARAGNQSYWTNRNQSSMLMENSSDY